MGPENINYFNNVITDMRKLFSDGKFPDKSEYSFFYPDLVRSRRHGGNGDTPATIEMLTGPWIIIKHKKAKKAEEGYLIYYNGAGETEKEFVYFLDTLSHYQLLLRGAPIRLRFVGSHKNVKNNFNKAKRTYLNTWGNHPGWEEQLDYIETESVTTFCHKLQSR